MTSSLRSVLLFGLMTSLFFAGCNKNNKKKNSTYHLIKTDKIYFTRAHDRASGILALEFADLGLCNVQYWPANMDEAKANAQKKTLDCSGSKLQQRFDVKLTELSPDTVYVMRIEAWSDKLPHEVYTAKETPTDADVSHPEPFGEIYVSRFDIPLKTASVHRFTFKSEQEALAFSKNPQRDIGCMKTASIKDVITAPVSSPAPNIKISKLSSRGFATANATTNPNSEDVQNLIFENLQFGDRLEYTYDLGSSSYRFATQLVNSFDALTVSASTSQKSQKLPLKGLRDDFVVLDVASTDSINLAWTLQKASKAEQVLLVLNDLKGKESLFCVFNGKDQKGSVDAALLSKLSPAAYTVTIYLEDRSVIPVAGDVSHSWFIETYDWRGLAINKI